MSDSGQKQTWRGQVGMPAFAPKADTVGAFMSTRLNLCCFVRRAFENENPSNSIGALLHELIGE
jgi:hypothetical protein